MNSGGPGSTNKITTANSTPGSTSASMTQASYANGQYSFTVSGTSGGQYVVQASTNMLNWVSLQTNTAPFQFVDPNASQFKQRFYRTLGLTNSAASNLIASLTIASTTTASLTQASYANGQYSFTVTGTSGLQYIVEASTNMVNWVPVATNFSPFQFVDPNAGQFQQRFYRAF
jgi:hypothetical protein